MSNVTSDDGQRSYENSSNLKFEAEDASNPISRGRKLLINPCINFNKKNRLLNKILCVPVNLS